jgi:hypothetical protein
MAFLISLPVKSVRDMIRTGCLLREEDFERIK